MDLQALISRLGGIRPVATDHFHPMPESEILALEKELQVRFPKAYRDFIAQYGASAFNGASPDNPYVEFRTLTPLPENYDSGKVIFAALYGAETDSQDGYSLRARTQFYAGRMPDAMIPIGDSWGSQICLGIKGDEFGKVYFWDEQNEPLDEASYLQDYGTPRPAEAVFQNVYLVANSFDDFLQKLELAEGS